MWNRNCPKCGNEITYKSKGDYNVGLRNNSKCPSCANRGSKRTEEQCKNISNSLKGKMSWNRGMSNEEWLTHLSDESYKRMIVGQFKRGHTPINIEKRKGKTYEEIYGVLKSDEIKRKLSENSMNNNPVLKQKRINNTLKSEKFWNAFKNKERNKKISDALTGKKQSTEHRQKLSNARKGLLAGDKNPSKRGDVRRKIRKSVIERIEQNKLDGNQLVPNYNPTACHYFNKLMEQTNTFIQHAENVGEYHIKELGYWVDGYDKENNIVYEYDEKHHFVNGKLKEKDKLRQKEIEEFLGCKFIRINYEE